jgi:hypothetical protein
MKNQLFKAGEPWPAHIEPYLMISIMGRELVHLTPVYPNENASLCGRATRGNSYDRSPDVLVEFSRKLCGDCSAIAGHLIVENTR